MFELRDLWAERLHPYAYNLVRPFEMRLAIARQKAYCGTYVGITGSCGKTTTTRLVSAVLADHGEVVKGQLLNTERQVFRTLRKLDHKVDFVVQEISAGGGPGYLDRIVDKLRFDVGIVTAIGKEHRSAFPDIEAIAAEKSRILQAVHREGLSVLNADDPLVLAMAKLAGGKVVRFGVSSEADVRGEDATAKWPKRLEFSLVIEGKCWPVRTKFAGSMMLPNVLAALAVAHGLGLDIEQAIARVGTVEAAYEHMSIHEGADGHTYVLDTSKAPLWSTKMLVDDLPNFAAENAVFVLAQVSETFGDTSQCYLRLLRKAAQTMPLVIAVGRARSQAKKLQAKEGYSNIVCAETPGEVRALLATLPPSLVIAKAASVSKLSRVFLGASQTVTCDRPACHISQNCRNCQLLPIVESMGDGPAGPASDSFSGINT